LNWAVQFAVQPSGQVAVQLASQLQGVQLRLLLVPAGRQIRKLSPFFFACYIHGSSDIF
jgi:hypothetical protein